MNQSEKLVTVLEGIKDELHEMNRNLDEIRRELSNIYGGMP